MKVVLLCRVSTQTQDYTRQVNELTDYCDKANWSKCLPIRFLVPKKQMKDQK